MNNIDKYYLENYLTICIQCYAHVFLQKELLNSINESKLKSDKICSGYNVPQPNYLSKPALEQKMNLKEEPSFSPIVISFVIAFFSLIIEVITHKQIINIILSGDTTGNHGGLSFANWVSGVLFFVFLIRGIVLLFKYFGESKSVSESNKSIKEQNVKIDQINSARLHDVNQKNIALEMEYNKKIDERDEQIARELPINTLLGRQLYLVKDGLDREQKNLKKMLSVGVIPQYYCSYAMLCKIFELVNSGAVKELSDSYIPAENQVSHIVNYACFREMNTNLNSIKNVCNKMYDSVESISQKLNVIANNQKSIINILNKQVGQIYSFNSGGTGQQKVSVLTNDIKNNGSALNKRINALQGTSEVVDYFNQRNTEHKKYVEFLNLMVKNYSNSGKMNWP